MSVVTDPFVAADLAAMIPEVWTPIVEEEFFAKSVLANFFLNLSSYAVGGGDILHIPDVYTNAFSVRTQSTQGAEVTTEGPAQVDGTLTIDTHKYLAHIIGDKDQVQLWKNYDFNGVYARKTAGTLVKALEAAIAALWSSLSTNTQGDTSDVLTDYDIRYGMEKIAARDVPMEETAWFVHPFIWWMQIYGITKYYKANEAGNKDSLVMNGNFGAMDVGRGLVGQLYGRPVFSSTNIVGALSTYRNIFAHKHALGYAIQTPGSLMVRTQAENAIRNLGFLTVSDIIYGVSAVREKVGAAVSANQTAVTS